jgi:hypothetical protein
MLLFSFLNVYSQTTSELPYFKDNVFYSTLESGIGEKIPMPFRLTADAEMKIKETTIYQNWEKVTFSNPANEKYIEIHKSMQHFEMFLMGETFMASFYAKMKMKNGTSYSPVKGGEGMIYVNDKGEINISFPCQGQNGYGNTIISKVYYSIIWNESKKDCERSTFIM